jgi:hypothetical protein
MSATMKWIRLTAILLLSLSAQTLFSQRQFSYKASLVKVDSSGFYQFPLPLNILSKSHANLADIRIFNSKNEAIPFLIQSGQATVKNELLPLPIMSKAIMQDKKMHVQLKNSGMALTQLVLEVQNAYASRSVNINGSNDGKEWFIIRDDVTVNTSGNDSNGTYLFVIDLPVSNAAYFDIAFNNKDLLPVNILNAGTYKYYAIPVHYDTVRTSSVSQKDSSNKSSYVTITWDEAYHFEQLKLIVTGPKYYRREIIFNNNSDAESNVILQAGSNEWLPLVVQAKQVPLTILNEDNPPLQIASAEGLVRKSTLYTWLEKDKLYTLYVGDSLAKNPNYDLVYFKDLIPGNAPGITLGAIEENSVEKVLNPPIKSNKPIIWLAMGAALIALLFITYRFTGEVKKRHSQ